jgi:DNA recombination-dependent growth factor C
MELIESIWRWIFVISAIILLDLIFIETLPRIVRQSRRLIGRLNAMADLPLVAQAEKAERDIARVNTALDALPALQQRARAAVASIMATRLRVR